MKLRSRLPDDNHMRRPLIIGYIHGRYEKLMIDTVKKLTTSL